jgi:hypothetical protein
MRSLAAVALALWAGGVAAHAQDVKRVQGFSVVLLLGDAQGTAQPENISAPARKALADIKDFLPYKSFRVVDTVWIAGGDVGYNSGGFRADSGNYAFELRTFPRVNGATPGTADSALARAQFKLIDPPGQSHPPSTVLDTSFNIAAGETVVVGTSRVQGDKALIVLLSAVAAK